jgi:hypothetical protein
MAIDGPEVDGPAGAAAGTKDIERQESALLTISTPWF